MFLFFKLNFHVHVPVCHTGRCTAFDTLYYIKLFYNGPDGKKHVGDVFRVDRIIPATA